VALWAVGGIAIMGGHSLLKLIPVVWISRLCAALMADRSMGGFAGLTGG